jgi:hypothetical protein
MTSPAIDNAESAILARVIAPDRPTLAPAVAEELLKWTFPDEDKLRMSELAAKARQGTLTVEEQAALDGYERVASFLGIVKSKARRSLQNVSRQ